jgi:putative CocE/NonD family hydrolase
MHRTLLSLLLLTITLVGTSHAADQYAVSFERNVAMKTRDGVTLHADIYRPKADSQFPVLLQRTPYDKNGGFTFGLEAASRGYVVVIQDVRGRYTSEGDWYVFKHESDDGFDTVEWAAALPYSNGKVGMWGGSYVGATQILAAIAHPPHLAGICPVVTASNYHDGWTYQSGAFEQWFDESWTSGLAQNTLTRQVAKATDATKGNSQLPLASYPLFNFPELRTADLTASLAPYFLDWLAHPTYDDYWKRWSIQEHYGDINVPVLTIAAWYDIFQGGSLRNFVGLKEHAGSEVARHGQHLLVTVGGHAGMGRKVGDVDFGPAAEFDENGTTLAWYDYLFKGVQNEFAQKPVKIFVMGLNQCSRRTTGRSPAPAAQNTFCTPKAARIPWAETAACRPRLRIPSHRTTTFTIPPTRCQPSAVSCVAIPLIWSQARATKAPPRPAPTFWCTRLPPFLKMWTSPARSASSCMPSLPPWTPTSPPS